MNPFEQIQPELGTGDAAPAGWRRLVEMPLLILVGGMGAGKSTTLQALAQAGFTCHLLPNRRLLTDVLIVTPQQRAEGALVQTLGRAGRLPYIRRYQERFPAGMAHALAQLWLDPRQISAALVFDGLRGEREVAYAAEVMPGARFLCLACPDRLRLERLLERQDPYDHFGAESATMEKIAGSFAELELSENQRTQIAALFSVDDERALFELVRSGQVSSAELRQKLSLLLEEHSLYNIAAAIHWLGKMALQRTLVIHTDQHSPPGVAEQTLAWFGA